MPKPLMQTSGFSLLKKTNFNEGSFTMYDFLEEGPKNPIKIQDNTFSDAHFSDSRGPGGVECPVWEVQ